MAFENVTLVAGGTKYEGWSKVTVTQALNEGTLAFQLEVSEVPNDDKMVDPEVFFQKWHFPPNTLTQIFANEDLLCDGVIDDYRPSAGPQDHTVVIVGRSRSRDFVDGYAKSATGQWDETPVEKIGQELDIYGVGIRVEVPTGPPVNYFRLRKGSTAHAEMMRLLPQRGLTLKGNKEGDMSITNASVAKRHTGALIQGNPQIERMSGLLTSRELYDLVETFGANEGDDTDGKDSGSKGTARTSVWSGGAGAGGAGGVRNKIIVAPFASTQKDLQSYAENEARRMQGFAAKATLQVTGWRDEGGKLWEPGWTVYTHSGVLKLSRDMLIEHAQWEQDDQGGTRTILSLVDPQSYNGESGGSLYEGGDTGDGGGNGGD